MALNTRKHHRSESPSATTTLNKKRGTNAPLAPTLPRGKNATNAIFRVVAGNSRPVSSGSRPLPVEYPPLDQFWIVFGDPSSSQYLRSASSLEEYDRYVKYFHGRLSLLVRGLHLLEIEAVFRATVPAWNSTADSDFQDAMQESFEAAYDWANAEILKKVRAYSSAWSVSPAGAAFKEAWRSAK